MDGTTYRTGHSLFQIFRHKSCLSFEKSPVSVLIYFGCLSAFFHTLRHLGCLLVIFFSQSAHIRIPRQHLPDTEDFLLHPGLQLVQYGLQTLRLFFEMPLIRSVRFLPCELGLYFGFGILLFFLCPECLHFQAAGTLRALAFGRLLFHLLIDFSVTLHRLFCLPGPVEQIKEPVCLLLLLDHGMEFIRLFLKLFLFPGKLPGKVSALFYDLL